MTQNLKKVTSHSLSLLSQTIFKTRQAQSSFLTWAGLNGDYATYLENSWLGILGGKLLGLKYCTTVFMS